MENKLEVYDNNAEVKLDKVIQAKVVYLYINKKDKNYE